MNSDKLSKPLPGNLWELIFAAHCFAVSPWYQGGTVTTTEFQMRSAITFSFCGLINEAGSKKIEFSIVNIYSQEDTSELCFLCQSPIRCCFLWWCCRCFLVSIRNLVKDVEAQNVTFTTVVNVTCRSRSSKTKKFKSTVACVVQLIT